ncbi:hypothetical protein [Parendozoicomonas sp. Alg238-R29]|uniref:hypothetical protein n=1 Tax=Parendozoicomonas sp. Alg238-R29 TaxID=2993446 RepID=UPI00248EA1F5|nr:hypothetical protein [Parendozoicomonas sp. Alg238-R29]
MKLFQVIVLAVFLHQSSFVLAGISEIDKKKLDESMQAFNASSADLVKNLETLSQIKEEYVDVNIYHIEILTKKVQEVNNAMASVKRHFIPYMKTAAEEIKKNAESSDVKCQSCFVESKPDPSCSNYPMAFRIGISLLPVNELERRMKLWYDFLYNWNKYDAAITEYSALLETLRKAIGLKNMGLAVHNIRECAQKLNQLATKTPDTVNKLYQDFEKSLHD